MTLPIEENTLLNKECPLFDFIIETEKKFNMEKLKIIVVLTTTDYPQRDYIIMMLKNGGLINNV